MPIKNYTTKVPAIQTVGKIQEILAAHGARKIMMDYGDDGHVEAVTFAIEVAGERRGFVLPAHVDAVAAVLAKQHVKCDAVTAENVAWRIIKDWIDAQMAFIESEQAAMDEVFFPYMTDRKGNTLYEAFRSGRLALGGGSNGI